MIAASLPEERRLTLWHAALLSALTAIAWSLGMLWAPLQPGVPLPFLPLMVKTSLLCIAAIAMLAGAVGLLLPMYGRPRDWLRAAAVAAYAATPVLVAGLLLVVPPLITVEVIAFPYACYLLFLGLQEVLAVKRGDAAEFVAVAMIAMAAASAALGGLLAMLGVI